jgi:hypothetical protein
LLLFILTHHFSTTFFIQWLLSLSHTPGLLRRTIAMHSVTLEHPCQFVTMPIIKHWLTSGAAWERR